MNENLVSKVKASIYTQAGEPPSSRPTRASSSRMATEKPCLKTTTTVFTTLFSLSIETQESDAGVKTC